MRQLEDEEQKLKRLVADVSRPGKPTDNGFVESFNGRFRDECLNTHWFLNLDDARCLVPAFDGADLS
jgi:putative transposase